MPGPAPTKTILVAERRDDTREHVAQILKKRGFSVVLTNGVERALGALEARDVALAVVDVGLRNVDGIGLLERMRAEGHAQPVVVLTDVARVEEAVAAMQLGAVNYLTRPFDPDAFGGAVVGALMATSGAHAAPETSPRQAEPVADASADAGVEPAATPASNEPVCEATAGAIDDVRDGLSQGALNLPTIPLVVRELREVLDDPRASLDRLVRVVSADQELAMIVLRRANSAAYVGYAPVKTVGNAIVRLGVRAVLSLALRMLTERTCKGMRSAGLSDLAHQIWERTLLVARAARVVSLAMNRREPEEAYLLALFADIGEPFLLRFVDDVMARRGTEVPMERVRAELSAYHGRVGSAVLSRWKMPELTVTVAKRHHDLAAMTRAREKGDPLARPLHLLALARHVAHAATPPGFHGLPPRTDVAVDDCLAVLGMERPAFDGMVERLTRELDEGGGLPSQRAGRRAA